MMVDVYVSLVDGTVKEFRNVALQFPQRSWDARWLDLIPKKGDPVSLNFRAYSIREKLPEKVKIRKSDGAILDDGYRVTGNFVAVNIWREGCRVC